MNSQPTTSSSTHSRPGPLLIVLAYVGFISLGLPDALFGVAWPTIRNTFALPQSAAGAAFVAAWAGYFATSFFSGRLTHAVGIGLLLAGSTGLVALAVFGYAIAPVWALFVASASVHGLGSGAIDAGLNSYAAHHFSARQMNWLHACYCFGAMLGPLLMTAVLTRGRQYSVGYFIVAAVMLVLAILFLATWQRFENEDGPSEADLPRAGTLETLRHPAVLLQMAVFFVYTGLEVAISLWAFTVLTEARGVHRGLAGSSVGAFWASIGIGRVVFGLVADRVGIDRLLRCCLLVVGLGTVLFAAPLPALAAIAGLILAGLSLAPVYPCLMTRTPQRLGKALSAHAVGFQVGAAMIGAAAVPATLGVVASGIGLSAVPIGTVVLAAILWLLHEVLVQSSNG